MFHLYKKFFRFFVIILLASPIYGQYLPAIEVFKSTREDVRNRLGKPSEEKEFADRFDAKSEEITVYYSDGKCNYELFEDWRTVGGIVETVIIRPKNKIKFEKSLVAKNQLSVGYKSANTEIYENKKKGVEYVVDKMGGAEFIDVIKLVPPSQKRSLICIERSENCFDRASISFYTAKDNYQKGEVAEIFATLGNTSKDYEIVWKTTDGKIIEGQNTLALKVDTSKLKGESITVTAEIKKKLIDGKICRKLQKQPFT